jgi:hypothetical protein
MTRFAFVLVTTCSLLAGLAGCKENPVGRPCFIPTRDGGFEGSNNRVSAPSVECQSKICLHIADRQDDMCTGECEVDDDCDAVDETVCEGGFICMTPTATGDFCCKKLCVCRDHLNLGPEDRPVELPQCDPADSRNECCNLAGRETTEQCVNREATGS